MFARKPSIVTPNACSFARRDIFNGLSTPQNYGKNPLVIEDFFIGPILI